MRITTKTRYATRALVALALEADGEPMSLSQVAQGQGISLKYLEALFTALRNANLVQSVRGSQGGYRLARRPEQITLREVYDTLEGHEAFVACIDDPATCDRAVDCVVREVWCEFYHESMKVLERVTLAELARRARERQQSQRQVLDYAI